MISLIVYFLAQTLTAEMIFRSQALNTVLQSDLTVSKAYERTILDSKLNYLVVRR